jgi:glycosyltransferase involved in cell wall biosynthesis
VIDDGSHDATAMICRNLIKESPVRMRLLQHPDGLNLGVSASRQLGCAEASGEFIALLDADDLFLPERLERGIDTLRASPGTAAMCSLGHNVDLDGKPIRGYNGTLIAGDWASIDGGLSPPFTFDQLWDAYPIANSSLTVRRSAMQVVGGYPALMAHQAEDWLLVLKLSLLSPIPCIEEPLMHYTHHAQAYTTLYNEQGLHEGARIEIFYHLVWWMLHKEEYAPAGHRFFRREYPRLISDHQRLLPLLRNYVQLGGHAADGLKGVEEYVRRLYEESMALRRVADAKLTENRCLRKLLGREHSDDDDLLQQLQQECESLHRVLRHIQEENRQLRAALDDTDHAELPEN